MKPDSWASFAEIASDIAVVVTLLIHIAGVRENTEITRTAMYADTLDQFNALETEILLDPDLVPIYYRYLIADPTGLGPEDQERVGLIVPILFRTSDRACAATRIVNWVMRSGLGWKGLFAPTTSVPGLSGYWRAWIF